MDSAQLAKALDFLQRRNLNLQRLMVIRNGYLVLDAPIYSPTGEAPYDREAVARSFLSALVGIAIDRGIIKSLDHQAPEPQPVPPLPETASRISGRTIVLEENDLGWQDLQLDFSGGAEAEFTIGSQQLTAPIGLDNVPRIITVGRPEIGDGVILASWGQWKEPDVFVTEITQEDIFFQLQVTLTLTFLDEDVTLLLEVPGEGKFEMHGTLEP